MAAVSRRDRGVTAFILGFFAAAWFGWGQAEASPTLSSFLIFGSFAALVVAVIGAIVGFRSPGADAVLRDRAAGRRYGIAVGIEFAACFAGAGILAALGQAPYIAAWICLVVGVHFFPLAGILRNPRLTLLAALMTAVAIAAFITEATGKLAASTVAGVGTGVLFLVFGVYSFIP